MWFHLRKLSDNYQNATLCWAKFSRKRNGRKLQKVAENGVELKPIVFAKWTSQGLNLGPPDYESVALTN